MIADSGRRQAEDAEGKEMRGGEFSTYAKGRRGDGREGRRGRMKRRKGRREKGIEGRRGRMQRERERGQKRERNEGKKGKLTIMWMVEVRQSWRKHWSSRLGYITLSSLQRISLHQSLILFSFFLLLV